MVTIPFIGFIAFCFVGMTAINRILEAAYINSNDVAMLNQLTIFRSLDIGLFSVPVPNLQWVTGITHLVQYDYSYFGGNAAFIQYLFYSITGAAMIALGIVVIGLLYNYFGNR